MNLPELPFALQPYGPEGGWTYENGTLTGRAGARQDRFVPPGGDSLDPASDAPRLLGAAPAGDFQLIARVKVGFAAAFDAGVLHLHTGDREWAKLCLELSPERPTICTVVTRGHSDDVNSSVVDGDTHWLRLSRTGRLRLPRLGRRREVDLRPRLHPRHPGAGGHRVRRLPRPVTHGRGLRGDLRPDRLPAGGADRPPRRQLTPFVRGRTGPGRAGGGTGAPARTSSPP